MQNMQATSEKIFDEINGYLEASHTRALNTQKQSVEHIDQMQQQIKQSFESTQQHLSENLTTLDNQLQQTLNQSLITLAQQLGSLSTKFAQDYEPITTNLKKVMDSMGRGIQ
jgi:DNA anti-recombination protein RmuC